MTSSANSMWGNTRVHWWVLGPLASPSPPTAAFVPARAEKNVTPGESTFGDLSAGLAPACRNPVAGRPPLSEPLHLIVLLPIPPPPPPDSVGDRHHGLVKPLARIAGRLRSCGTQWPPTFFVWARSVRWVPHVCTSVLLHPTYSATPV